MKLSTFYRSSITQGQSIPWSNRHAEEGGGGNQSLSLCVTSTSSHGVCEDEVFEGCFSLQCFRCSQQMCRFIRNGLWRWLDRTSPGKSKVVYYLQQSAPVLLVNCLLHPNLSFPLWLVVVLPDGANPEMLQKFPASQKFSPDFSQAAALPTPSWAVCQAGAGGWLLGSWAASLRPRARKKR